MAKLFLGTREVTPAIMYNGHLGKYQLLQRIIDDSNNEIGTVSGYVVDSNNNEYAVVCLDAIYRGSGQILNTNVSIPDLPTLNNWASAFWGSYKMSGKEITDIILQFCSDNDYSSSACTLCRNLSFVIDGVTYYGQTPTANEVYNILCNRAAIENADITASTYTSNNLSSAKNMLTNAVYVSNYILYFNTGGRMADGYITQTNFVCPVIELPNSL